MEQSSLKSNISFFISLIYFSKNLFVNDASSHIIGSTSINNINFFISCNLFLKEVEKTSTLPSFIFTPSILIISEYNGSKDVASM